MAGFILFDLTFKTDCLKSGVKSRSAYFSLRGFTDLKNMLNPKKKYYEHYPL